MVAVPGKQEDRFTESPKAPEAIGPMAQEVIAHHKDRATELERQLAQAIKLIDDYGDQLKSWASVLREHAKQK